MDSEHLAASLRESYRLSEEALSREDTDAQAAMELYEKACDCLFQCSTFISSGIHRTVISTILSTLHSRQIDLRHTILVAESQTQNTKNTAERETKVDTSPQESERSVVLWEDILGLEAAKQILKETIMLPQQFPQFFHPHTRIAPWTKILLYGPPGTGKTQLAKAMATELSNSSYISVSNADLLSCWLGQSERMIVEIFQSARKKKNGCLLFFDEIDGLCRARSASEDETTRRIKNEMLKQLDGYTHLRARAAPPLNCRSGIEYGGDKQSNVFVLAATNRPWELDSAVLRRFQKRVFIPLPDVTARRKIFEKGIGTTSELASDFQQLAEQTEGFSGSDLTVVINDGFMEAMRRIQNERRSLTSSELNDQAPILFPTLADFTKSVAKNKSAISIADLQQYESWTAQFGSNGNE